MPNQKPPYHDKPIPLRENEIREIATVAADEAVIKVFRALGLDIQELEHINALRDDFKYVRDQREGSEEAKKLLKKTGIGVAIGAIPGMLYLFWDVVWTGIKLKLGGS
jgi:hypothetical protein